jgi:anti-sigma B factor antagonist
MSNVITYSKVKTIELSRYVSAANASELEQTLATALKIQDHTILFVDMEKVEFLDSSGLMVLVNSFRLAQSIGKKLILGSVAPSVRMVFELTQLDKVIDILEDQIPLAA